MLNFIKNFRNDEDGAVTVDWVVLTAAIVALGILVGSTVSGGVKDVSDKIAADMKSASEIPE
ncbi:MAG: hypothetical protein R6V30_01365 [Paracoccaceae bacterium]